VSDTVHLSIKDEEGSGDDVHHISPIPSHDFIIFPALKEMRDRTGIPLAMTSFFTSVAHLASQKRSGTGARALAIGRISIKHVRIMGSFGEHGNLTLCA
jgi:hypothetical protein